MSEIKATDIIARILKEEGIEWYAGVHGGHIWSLMSAIANAGIRMYHMRHEQSGAWMADGWARVTRKPGVCFATAGPGFANAIPGIYLAYLAKSPIVCLFGQHPPAQDTWGGWQEAYAAEVCESFTKWSKRLIDPTTVPYFLQKAFRDATTYPCGPVVLEIPANILNAIAGDENNLNGYLPKGRCAPPAPPAGNPAMVEKVVRMLMEAKQPAIIGGDGIHWSDAASDLKEFVELLNIPVHTRRMGRGAVPEEHPLAFSGGFRRPILNKADVLVIIGLRMNTLEHYGMSPTYPSENTRYIVIAEDMEELTTRMPAEISIFGNPKVVLRQMIDCARDLTKNKPERTEWLDFVSKAKADDAARTRAAVDKVRNNRSIHPDFLAAELMDFLDKDATIILDSFTMSGFITDKVKARFTNQILDASTFGGVGHGVGLAMGAQLGRPGKQVVDLLGDGGLGCAGWDIETAAHNKIPACFLLYNNSAWVSNLAQKMIMPNLIGSWGMQTDIRYDKIFAEMGCHTELVTEPRQIKPALERAFNSGKTMLINVIPDKEVLPPQLAARLTSHGGHAGKQGKEKEIE